MRKYKTCKFDRDLFLYSKSRWSQSWSLSLPCPLHSHSKLPDLQYQPPSSLPPVLHSSISSWLLDTGRNVSSNHTKPPVHFYHWLYSPMKTRTKHWHFCPTVLLHVVLYLTKQLYKPEVHPPTHPVPDVVNVQGLPPPPRHQAHLPQVPWSQVLWQGL